MDIGKEVRTIQVDPIQTPVPQREQQPRTRPARPPVPRKEPAGPAKKPVKTPVKR